eukprot:c21257_g1_i1.p1 GENE.c21257_g1_i1~~c21257_g1_i1.p1  ORF type:complete len:1091 (+),score=416.38 c21257_g1_i1:263-3274(+)
MFYHGYNNYMTYAFPHDELKPISGSWTDSLIELGNAKKTNTQYSGCAMTLIDSLDALAVFGNKTEFEKQVRWVIDNISFDIDARVHLFEANIRLLGGLLSAHLLASDKSLDLMSSPYNNELLTLSYNLAKKLLPAFQQRAFRKFPYAWVNLKTGIENNESSDTCTAGIGTLILEFGILSFLTDDYTFFDVADQAMNRLWVLKSNKGLFGNTLDGKTGRWTNPVSGIGSGIDSFYEYLFKSFILFGDTKYMNMFRETYDAVNKHLKSGPWYIEADMSSGSPTYWHFNSLQAFWPGLQVLYGDLESAIQTHDAFFSVWEKFGALPERFLISSEEAHQTENYYPQRPEIIESTWYLYHATKDPKYLQMGIVFYESYMEKLFVKYGFAHVKDVRTGVLEDRMSSFFLTETCKYLYLLFDKDNFVNQRQVEYIFTTEGHIFPITKDLHEAIREHRKKQENEISTLPKEEFEKNEHSSTPNLTEMKNLPCILKNEGYWSYHYCHEKWLKQIHFSPNNKPEIEYILGQYDNEISKLTVNPIKKSQRSPVLVSTLPHGSFCQSINSHRQAKIEFHCDTELEPKIVSVQESTICSYVIIISTKLACKQDNKKKKQQSEEKNNRETFAIENSNEILKVVLFDNSKLFCPNVAYKKNPFYNYRYSQIEKKSAENEIQNGGGIAPTEQCIQQPEIQTLNHGPLRIEVGTSAFSIIHENGEEVSIRHLGFPVIDIVDRHGSFIIPFSLQNDGNIFVYQIQLTIPNLSPITISTSLALFSNPIIENIIHSSLQTNNIDQYILNGEIRIMSPIDGCSVSTKNKDFYNGKIVYIDRGTCSFVDKVFAAQKLGAIAVIIGNTKPAAEEKSQKIELLETLFTMAGDDSANSLNIPAFMVQNSVGKSLKQLYIENEELNVIAHFLRTKHSEPQGFNFNPDYLNLIVEQKGVNNVIDNLCEQEQEENSSCFISNYSEHQKNVVYLRGNPNSFQLTTMGKWEVNVHKHEEMFLLSVQTEQKQDN